MIITHELDKITDRGFLLEPDSHLWRRAHMELAIPYFLLTYEVAQDIGWLGHTEIYWEVSQLLHCCAQVVSDERLRLAQIALISPSWMNRQDGWQLDTIREIWQGRTLDGTYVGTHFVTSEGKRLTDRRADACETSVIKLLAVEKNGLYVSPQP